MNEHLPPTSYPRFPLAFVPGELATIVFLDPFGNAPTLKAFRDIDRLFAKQP